ncbi:hypothetical protein K7X08_038070 [Anisodus acutangulus]|uniref:protein-serine/threonine phosphatase n=1 Tax=Anisodus acutangulus TaxID=402998 RepID=A0A9Q1MZ06_9SOLA|nr:hypothetical protein K7X08_038070 [Anisodus acutangulus]
MAVVQANSSLKDQSQVLTSPSATYVGVYDGHGGPEAARFVNRHLLPYLHSTFLFVSDFGFTRHFLMWGHMLVKFGVEFQKEQGCLSSEVIKRAFGATEEDFIRLVKQSLPLMPKIATVGSCCLVGAISGSELYVANLGDSRTVLGRRGYDGESSKVVAERLSTDHNVSCEKVWKEVESLHPDDSSIVVYCRGVWRVKGIIQRPELIRDPVYQQYGNPVPLKRAVLSAEPSIVARKIRPHDLFVIFASDGLWEHLSDEAAVEIVFKSPRAGIAKRLVGAALKEAAKKREMRYKDIKKIEKVIRRHFHDDITVIVIYLDHQKNSFQSKGTVGCIAPPVDISSYHSDGVADEPSG